MRIEEGVIWLCENCAGNRQYLGQIGGTKYYCNNCHRSVLVKKYSDRILDKNIKLDIL